MFSAPKVSTNWLASLLATLLTALLVCSAPACNTDTATPAPSTKPAIVEPIIPQPKQRLPLKSALPKWASQLPDVAIDAKPGDKVWAVAPRSDSEMADIGLYELEGVFDGLASLINTMGHKVDRVPGAVVHPVGSSKKLRKGDIALVFTWTTPGWLALVHRATRGKEIRVRFDLAGATKEVAVDHAEPMVKKLLPLAYVGFPKSGTTSMGLVVAVDEQRGWVLTASGHIEIHALDRLNVLPIKQRGYKIGSKVLAFRWASGFQRGVIRAVGPLGLRFTVQLEGDQPQAPFFFTRLVGAK